MARSDYNNALPCRRTFWTNSIDQNIRVPFPVKFLGDVEAMEEQQPETFYCVDLDFIKLISIIITGIISGRIIDTFV
jgi:hypothetical protein